jgi:hypothetical protein
MTDDPGSSVMSACDDIECGVGDAVAAISGAATPAAVPAPLRVLGQVCRKRTFSSNLVFLTLRQARSPSDWDTHAPRLQAVARLQEMGGEPMSGVRRLVKLGDLVAVVGVVQAGDVGPELLLSSFAVRERWAVACRGRGFEPDIEPPPAADSNPAFMRSKKRAAPELGGGSGGDRQGVEGTAMAAVCPGPDEAPLCKFWINQGVCKRAGCRFRHRTPGDERPWKEIRTQWQRERS